MNADVRYRVSVLLDGGRYAEGLHEADCPDLGLYWPDERYESALWNVREVLEMIIRREVIRRRKG